MASQEHITHEPDNAEAWTCLCKNTPTSDGFYPCDRHGNEVTPTLQAWTTGCYVCRRCGRIIEQQSLAVVGRKAGQPNVQ